MLQNDFKEFNVRPTFGGMKKYKDHALYDSEGNRKEHLDFHQNSSYRTNFRGLTVDGVYHEKNPIFPVYSMPFKDASSYQKTFNLAVQPIKEEREFDHNMVEDLKKRCKQGYYLYLLNHYFSRVLYQDMPFEPTTTTKSTIGFGRPYDKATLCPPPYDVRQ